MNYTQLTEPQIGQMLATIGVASVEELFSTIPPPLRLREPLRLPTGVDELSMLADVGRLAQANVDCTRRTCFLGAGAYDHFIPTVVDALAGQGEFVTAYTPYQAEASQGTLQLFYEFQTMVCQLTGMDVANASLYEAASATAEAVMMATGVTGRRRAVLAGAIHPHTASVLETYSRERDIELVAVRATDGVVDAEALHLAVDEATAAVVIQSPNFWGCLERLDLLIPPVKKSGALAVVISDPIASGVFKPPGAFGADLVVAEGQALGIPMQYGGPYLGLLAGREPYLRRMPGRIVGMTRDRDGRRAFCLTLQTREQHIKRERATSNVCTNQGLLAIRAAVYLAVMGRKGVTRAAQLCFDKAHYAAERISKLPGYSLCFPSPFFKEFVVRTRDDVSSVLDRCRDRGLLAGVSLGPFDREMRDCFLVAVTEKRTREEIDRLVDTLGSK